MFLWIVSGSFIGAVVIWRVIQSLSPQDALPVDIVVWSIPLTYSIGLTLFGLKLKRLKIFSLGLVCAVLSLALASLLANNYYHFYPTVFSIFQKDAEVSTTQQPVSDANKRANIVLEDYYQPLPSAPISGQLLILNIPSQSHFSPRQGRIYLPPALQNNSHIRLPVIVLLPGYPGSPVHWEQAGILAIMNDFAQQHKGLAPIVAVVDFSGQKEVDTECVDSKLGDAESYLTKDVPKYLKQHYQVETDPAAWAIGGYSAGGTCASLIAIRNPSVYQNFMNISGDALPSLETQSKTLETLFNGSPQNQAEHTPNTLLRNRNKDYSNVHGWYFYGKDDNPLLISRMKEQQALASRVGMMTVIASTSGPHSFTVWKQGYIEGLPWISNHMNLTVYEKK